MEQERENQAPETINIDGMNFNITPQDGAPPKVELPPEFSDLSQEEKEKLYPKIEEGSKTIGNYYRKLQETNEKQKSLTAWEEDLKKREEAAKRNIAGDPGNDQKDEVTPVWKRLKLPNEQAEEEFMLEHPVQHAKAVKEWAVDVARAEVKNGLKTVEATTRLQAQTQILNNRIVAAGVDPNDVMAFANEFGMPYSEKAFDNYVRYHAIKVDQVSDATIKAQKRQVTFVESSGNSDIMSLIRKMETDPDSITEAENKRLIEFQRKQLARS